MRAGPRTRRERGAVAPVPGTLGAMLTRMIARSLSRSVALAAALCAAACTSEGQIVELELPPLHYAVVRAVGSAPKVTVTNEGPASADVRLYSIAHPEPDAPFKTLIEGMATSRTFLGPALVEIKSGPGPGDETIVIVKMFSGEEVAIESAPVPIAESPAAGRFGPRD